MKIFYKGIFALLVSILIVACSKDSVVEEVKDNSVANMNINTNTSRSVSVRAEGVNYYDATKTLYNDIGRDIPKLPLSQGDLDHFGDLINYEGHLEAEAASRIADHVSYAQEVGVRKYMDERMDYREFTKETILRIVENGPIVDIQSNSEFQGLPKGERKVILGVNKIASDYAEGNRSASRVTGGCTMNGQPAPCSFVGAVAGATVGFMAGNSLCGIPCGVGGAILGGIIGWFVGGGEK